jgi:uncharacterized protein (DUF305 family)
MRLMNAGRITAGLFAAAVLGGCAGASPGAATAGVAPRADSAAAAARAPLPHSAADARFMSDMIMHHSQAVLIAGWAPTHGASEGVRRLAERIVVGQQDEMAIMQRWLRERGVTPPADSGHADGSHADGGHAGMDHAGMDHGGMDHSSMPGMLSPDELKQLDAARGTAFDRLFLTLMTKHHQGAVVMVEQLLGSQNAAQDETVFRIASDVSADQTAEIRRMQQMLSTLPSDGQGR